MLTAAVLTALLVEERKSNLVRPLEKTSTEKWSTREPPTYSLYAVLVESQRINGAVRQKVLRHLAHIKERYLDAFAHQEYFWERVDWHLDEMQIEPQDRSVVEAKLLATVPRPPQRDSEEWELYDKAIKVHYLGNHGGQFTGCVICRRILGTTSNPGCSAHQKTDSALL